VASFEQAGLAEGQMGSDRVGQGRTGSDRVGGQRRIGANRGR
jgi:hypothetical protein